MSSQNGGHYCPGHGVTSRGLSASAFKALGRCSEGETEMFAEMTKNAKVQKQSKKRMHKPMSELIDSSDSEREDEERTCGSSRFGSSVKDDQTVLDQANLAAI